MGLKNIYKKRLVFLADDDEVWIKRFHASRFIGDAKCPITPGKVAQPSHKAVFLHSFLEECLLPAVELTEELSVRIAVQMVLPCFAVFPLDDLLRQFHFLSDRGAAS